VINLDAHFDVRPLKDGKAHSGSPFRQMLTHELFHKNRSIFIEFGCKGATCSNEHYKFLQEHGAQVYWLEKHIRTVEMKRESQYCTQAGQLFNQIIEELQQKV
jgi:arginase family enzyme